MCDIGNDIMTTHTKCNEIVYVIILLLALSVRIHFAIPINMVDVQSIYFSTELALETIPFLCLMAWGFQLSFLCVVPEIFTAPGAKTVAGLGLILSTMSTHAALYIVSIPSACYCISLLSALCAICAFCVNRILAIQTKTSLLKSLCIFSSTCGNTPQACFTSRSIDGGWITTINTGFHNVSPLQLYNSFSFCTIA